MIAYRQAQDRLSVAIRAVCQGKYGAGSVQVGTNKGAST